MALPEMNPGLTVMEMPGSAAAWRVGNAAMGLGFAFIAALLIWQAALPVLARGGLVLLVGLGFLRYTSRRIIRLCFTAEELQLLLMTGRRHYEVESLELFEVFPSYANSMARVKIRRKGNRWPEYFWFQSFYTNLGWPPETVAALRKAGIERGLTPATPHYEMLDILYRPVSRSWPSSRDSDDAA